MEAIDIAFFVVRVVFSAIAASMVRDRNRRAFVVARAR
jgi:hypothetical protein